MKKTLIILAMAMIPSIMFAYSVSGGSRSYSAPSRSYSAPSYSAPARTYTAPTRSYTVTPSAKTYTAPVRSVTPTVSTKTTEPSATANTSISTSGGYGYNPFSSNFLLWYWLFARPNQTIQTNATTTQWSK